MSNKENGRSMVEILGVLIVLSMVGVFGASAYKYGMNRYLANRMIADLHDMAYSASLKLTSPGSSRQFNIVGALKYPYTSALDQANKAFSITVSSVPGSICSAVLAKGWDLPYEIQVNNVENGTCNGVNNVMKFSFYERLYDKNADLPPPPEGDDDTGDDDSPGNGCQSEIQQIRHCDGTVSDCCPDTEICEDETDCPCQGDEDCGSCEECVNGECISHMTTITSCDGTVSDCCPDTETCEDETDCPCLSDGDCGSCEECVNGECISHATTVTFCDGRTESCCPDTQTCADETNCCQTAEDCSYMFEDCINYTCQCPSDHFRNTNGNCTACSNQSAKATSAEECSKCDNTPFHRTYSGGKCNPSGCPSGYFKANISGTGTLCIACSEANRYAATEAECNKCANAGIQRYMIGSYCALNDYCPTGYAEASDRSCQSCSATGTFTPYDETECYVCDSYGVQRIFWTNTKTGAGSCTLCGTGYFVQTASDWSSCKECSDGKGYAVSDRACSACDNTATPRHMTASGQCVRDCTSAQFTADNGSCVDCTEGVYSDKNNWKTTSAECQKCGTERRYEDSYCLPNCPEGYFQNTNGNCTDCSNQSSKATSAEECNKCNSTPFHRTYSGGKCNPSSCPSGYFKASTSSGALCKACSDPESYTATASDCNKCGSTRQMSGTLCVLNE